MNYTNFTNLAAETISVGPPGEEKNILTGIAELFSNVGIRELYECDSKYIPSSEDFQALHGARLSGLLNEAPLYYSISFSAADVGKVIGMVPPSYRLIYADERHTTPAGQACAIQVELLDNGVAPGAGTNLLESPLDLALSENNVRTESGNATLTGDMDAIALKLVSGDAASFAGGFLFLCFHYIRDDNP